MQGAAQGRTESDDDEHETHEQENRKRIEAPPEHGKRKAYMQKEFDQQTEPAQTDDASAQNEKHPVPFLSHGIPEKDDHGFREQQKSAAYGKGKGQKPTSAGFQRDIEGKTQGHGHRNGEKDGGISPAEPERQT